MSFFTSRSDVRQTEEFTELLRIYGDLAYRMALQLTGWRDAEARDLVQEAFVRIWRQWDNHRPSSMKGWLYRVMQNLYLDAARHRARHPSVPLDAIGMEGFLEERLSDGQASVDQQLEAADLRNDVSAALARLDPDYRIVVVLCDMEGLAYEDIARILQCPIGTVRSRIHRGRQQLRRLLQPVTPSEVVPCSAH